MRGILIYLLLAFMLPGLVNCMRPGSDTVVIRDNPVNPGPVTNVQNGICYNYNRTRVLWSGQTTAMIGNHDGLSRLYYDIQLYPAGTWLKIYGTCFTR